MAATWLFLDSRIVLPFIKSKTAFKTPTRTPKALKIASAVFRIHKNLNRPKITHKPQVDHAGIAVSHATLTGMWTAHVAVHQAHVHEHPFAWIMQNGVGDSWTA